MRIGTPSSRPSAIASATVLGGELEGEVRRIVFAGQELIEQAVEREAAAADALAHRFPQRRGVHAGFHAHRERLGERTCDRIARHIVHELGGPSRCRSARHRRGDPPSRRGPACAGRRRPCRRQPRSPSCATPRRTARRSPAHRACARPWRQRPHELSSRRFCALVDRSK